MMKKIALVLCSLFLSLALGELILKLNCSYGSFCASKFFSISSHGENIYSEEDIVYLKKNSSMFIETYDYYATYQINELGLRDDPGVSKKPDKKIVALGDSFIFGEGLHFKQTLVEILEQQTGVEFLNFGVPGYGIGQIYLHYKNKVNLIQNIRGVVLFFYPTLYFRNHISEQEIASNSNFDFLKDRAGEKDSNIKIKKQFEILYFLKFWKARFDQRELLKEPIPSRGKPYKVGPVPVFLLPEIEDRNRRFVKYLRLIRELTPNVPFCVVNISTAKLNLLDETARKLNFKYFDLSKEIAEHSKENNLGFEYDSHYNSKTNKLIASKFAPLFEDCFRR